MHLDVDLCFIKFLEIKNKLVQTVSKYKQNKE